MHLTLQHLRDYLTGGVKNLLIQWKLVPFFLHTFYVLTGHLLPHLLAVSTYKVGIQLTETAHLLCVIV